MKKIYFIILLCIAPLIYSQNIDTLRIEKREVQLPFGLKKYESTALPNVSVVLSGGGSRGLTQLGILKVLEERNIPIHSIVGTSIGSIIGGLYASGYTLSALDSIIINAPWNDFFSVEQADRKELFIDQKITEDKSILTLRMDGLTPVIPTSINTGTKVTAFINMLSINAPIQPINSFDNLQFKFRAVATNLVTGKPFVMSDGSLSDALRASASISFLLPPVRTDSLVLVDGGVISNIPVDIAQKMGNDFIIAVNSTSPLKKISELVYPWEIADQLVTIPGKVLNRQQVEKADFTFAPDLGELNNSDFSSADSIIALGYIEGLKYADSIEAKIKEKFFNNLTTAEKYYSNLVAPKTASNIERYLITKYAAKTKVSNKQILYDLEKQFNSGNYKNFSAQISSTQFGDTLRVIEELNSKVKRIDYQGIKVLSEKYFKKLFTPLTNKPFNSKILFETLKELLQKYRKNGYILPRIESVFFNSEEGILTIVVDEGKITNITISGNKKTNPDVISREFNFKNKNLKYDEIYSGLNNLRTLNLFEEMKVSILRTALGNELDIKVKERPTQVIRLGLRADNENNLQMHADFREENLFGTGTDLGAIVSGGNRLRSFILEHRAHRIFNSFFTYSLRGYYQFNDVRTYANAPGKDLKEFDRVETGEYRQIFYGANLGLGRQIGKNANLIVEGKYEYNKIKGLTNFPEEDTYKEKIVSVKLKLNIDSQDRFPYPTKGTYLNSYYETSQKFLGGDISFAKFYADYHSYFQLTKLSNVNFRARFGFGDNTLPLSQQFSLGGQDNFFGYRDYEFRGRQIFSTSLEYRLMLPFEIFFPSYVRIRYDLGSVWANRENLKFNDFKHGVGITLSLDSPLGPADFSVGRSFLPDKIENGYIIKRGPLLFYFTIGYYF